MSRRRALVTWQFDDEPEAEAVQLPRRLTSAWLRSLDGHELARVARFLGAMTGGSMAEARRWSGRWALAYAEQQRRASVRAYERHEREQERMARRAGR